MDSGQDHEPLLQTDTGIRQTHVPISLTYRLYTSHALTTFTSRLFEFFSVLILASIYPKSLFVPSLYAICRSLAAIAFTPAVGRWSNSVERLRWMRGTVMAQRCACVGSCVGFAVLDRWARSKITERVKGIVLGGVIVLACAEKVAAVVNTISIERDWVVVVISEPYTEETLQELNASMRRIDLLCKLLGPLAVGILDTKDPRLAIWAVGSWNLMSMAIEMTTIKRVYASVPALSIRRIQHTTDSPTSTSTSDSDPTPPSSPLKTFLTSPLLLPSLSLSLTYLSLLSFSTQMSAYLLTQSLSPLIISLLRTLSVIFELSATIIAPFLMRRIGVVRAGLWSIVWQAFWVGIAGLGFWVPRIFSISPSPGLPKGLNTTTLLLVLGTILSRPGLWSLDLCTQTLLQLELPSTQLTLFSSIESSLQNAFELLSYCITLIFWDPSKFKFPVFISVGAVWISMMVQAVYVRGRRGHLVHFEFLGGCAGCEKRGHTSEDGVEDEREDLQRRADGDV